VDDAMLRSVRGASSRVVARVVGSRFAKPIARVALAAAGLLLLAFIGKTAVAGALGPVTSPAATSASAPVALPAPVPSPLPTPAPEPAATAGPAPLATPSSSTRATPDDPVILNTATVDDLRRLPGIGEKRATAALALRTRLGGRFHAVEDLLKVKGIGRATLRRLRPLVRLDPAPMPEAGVEAPR
jgi:competence protein ComEA